MNHLEVWRYLLQSYDTVKHLTRLLLHMMQNCTAPCGGGLWNIACLQVDCFYPEAEGAYPQAVRTLQMLIYSYFPGCNKGSREPPTKTTGRHRLSIQTLGLRHQLHQMGHGKERGRGPFVLQTSGKARLKWRLRITSRSLISDLMKWEHMSFVIHKWLPLKIINSIPSAADSVSDWKPPAGKVQYGVCATNYCALSVPILLLGLQCRSG